MKERFEDGLVFKRLDERGKVFIEYMPVEKVWKPITGENYMVINCLWVSGKFKGQGLSVKLLEECINDAKQKNMQGIAVVTSSKVKPFLTDRKFYAKHGFKTVDTAPPYFELMIYKLKEEGEDPQFNANAKQGCCANKKGFTFIYANQCPFVEEYIGKLAGILDGKKIYYEVKKLGSCAEAQQLGSPFGTLGIYYNGKFLTHELMTEKKFMSLVDKIQSAD